MIELSRYNLAMIYMGIGHIIGIMMTHIHILAGFGVLMGVVVLLAYICRKDLDKYDSYHS